MNGWGLALAACLGSAIIFATAFIIARRVGNYGLVDIVWAYALGLLAISYAIAGEGWPIRRALIALLAGIWSARLGTHLALRVIRHHPKEDSRYAQLRRDWSGHFGLKMFCFYQVQALSVVVLGAGFLLVALNPSPALHSFEVAGTALWLIALVGETIADHQLAAFQRTDAHRDKVCDTGLWRYSRHPNYFFEWLIWVAFFVFALGSPWGGIAIIAPASILWLLLRVTGIPMTEQQSLRSRGVEYRRYQQVTSAFFPLPPRRPANTVIPPTLSA